MTVAQASAVLDQALELGDDYEENHCGHVTAGRLPAGAQLMIIDGRVARIDVFEGLARTLSGAGIGSTEDEVRALYPGQIKTEPHPYTGPVGHYLVFVPHDAEDGDFGLIFETDGRVVTSFRAGLSSAVLLIEGCS